jgi:predicted ATPase/class 3 adenylate cyclase
VDVVTGMEHSREARKLASVVFCDLSGSTSLAEQLDAESLRRVVSRYYEEMKAVIERHGGTAAFSGDAVIGAFGLAELHEDDALRAVRSAAEMGSAMARLNDELCRSWGVMLDVRIGVNTGEVVAGDPAYSVSMVAADAFNVCARLEKAARPGEILIGDSTERLVRDAVRTEPLGPLAVRGKAQPVHAHRLVEVIDTLPGVVRDLSAPMVGRERELEQLVLAFERTVERRSCDLVMLVGDAGIGKSRLASELTAKVGTDVRVLRGRCLPYGDGITFWPVAEMVRDAAHVADDDSPEQVMAKIAALAEPHPDAQDVAERISGAIGVSDSSSDRDGIFWATRTLLDVLASRQPLLMLIDDLHWGEPTLIELVDDLVRRSEGPTMVLAVARRELLDESELEAAEILELSPLPAAEGRELVTNLLGPSDVAEQELEHIVGAAGGNPLFLEESLRMLIDEGALRTEEGRWRVATHLQEVPIPPTIHGLLGARLDRLEPNQRRVLERASVVGEEFWPAALSHLLPELQPLELGTCLAALAGKGLVQPGGTPFIKQPAFHFAHISMRDVAYEQLLKEDRAELHERLADWIEQKVGERAGEYCEILGYHLERAARWRDELRPLGDQGSQLGQRAATWLTTGGQKALARGDMSAAVNLLERTAALLPADDPARHSLLPKLGIALTETGDTVRADELFLEWIDADERAGSLLEERDGGRSERAVPLPGALEAAGRRGIFGRDSELELLREALAEARAGGRRGVMLAGDAGIGKTSLAALVAREAHAEGTVVLYGRCDEDLPIPYRPFAEALGHLVQHAPQELLESQVRHHGRVLTHLVPQLAQRLDTDAGARVPPEGDLYMMFSAAAGLLAEASGRAPLMIVLDDLHWADAPSIPLLKYILSASVEMSALIVGTYRTSEVTRDHPLRALLADLGEPAVTRVELAGLSEQAVIEMTAARARQRLDRDGLRLARTLHQETDGNPFFAIEILRHLIESHALVRKEGQWSMQLQVGELVLPESVVDTVNRRVARLAQRTGDRVQEVLSAAAALGREVDPSLLAAVLEADPDEVLELLDAACEAALLSRSPNADRYLFSHALIGQALYEQLGTAARRRLHRRIAESLEAACGADPGPRVGELARHWLACFEPQIAAKALDYVRQAGDFALEKLAPVEALRLYSSALERHDSHPEGGDRMRCELLIGLGTAQRRLGRAEFRNTLLDAARAARQIGADDLLVRAAQENTRGFVSETGEVDGERVAVLNAALDALADRDVPERARLLATLAAEQTFAGEWPLPLERSNQALALARRLGDPGTLTDILSARFMATWTPETLPERFANTAEELRVVEANTSDPLARFWALHWRATACIERGELHEAERRIAEEAEIAERIGQPTARWLAAYDRATQALIRGRLTEAEVWAIEAGGIGREGGQPEAEAFLGGQMVNIRFEQGRLMELETLIEHEARDKPGIPAFWAALALARVEAGDPDGAHSVMAVHAGDGFASFPYDPNWLVGLCLYAETCGQLGDRAAAAALEPKLAPWMGQIAFNSATVWGFVARHAGVLDRVLGRHDRAVERLQQAATLHERIGAPLWLARTRLDLGHTLLARGGVGDAESGLRLLDKALAAAEELGCATIAQRAAALVERGSAAAGNHLAAGLHQRPRPD